MKPYKEQTYYELLEVDPSASMGEIRSAYEKAVQLYDSESVALYAVGDSTQVEDLKKLLLEAFEILTDEDLRGEYDRSLGLAPWTSSGHTGIVAAREAMGHPPDAAEVDARAAAARKAADVELTAAVTVQLAQSTAAGEAAAGIDLQADAETIGSVVPDPIRLPVELTAEQATQGPGPKELDARADESRAEADARGESDAAAHPPNAVDPEPSQLVLTEVLSRAETIHSTAPRYSVSYIPRAPGRIPVEPGIVEGSDDEPSPAFGNGTRAPRAESSGRASERPLSPSAEVGQHRPSTDAADAVRSSPMTPSATSAEGSAAAPSSSTPLVDDASASGRPAPSAAPADKAAAMRPSGRELEQAQLIAQEAAIANAESALAQVSQVAAARARELREVRDVRPRAPEIPAEADITGELLRQVRKSRGLTVHQLSDRTRITVRHLENVEADRYEALPPPVYLRGILMSLARELALDPVRVSRSYLSLVDKALGKAK